MSQQSSESTSKGEGRDSKRALWIMAAAGLFLLVVVGAAMFLSSGKDKPTQDSASDGWVAENESALDWNAPPSDFDAPDNPFDGIYGINGVPESEKDESGLSMDDLKGDGSEKVADSDLVEGDSAKSTEDSSGDTTIDLNGLVQSSSVKAKNDYTVAQMESARETKSQTKSQSGSSSKTVSSSTAKSSKTSTSGDKFWVQVGSFEDINKANAARTKISGKGYPAEVFTYEDNGKMMYRVRVGSYNTKKDAESIRSKITAIDSKAFGNSFVVNSTAKRQ